MWSPSAAKPSLGLSQLAARILIVGLFGIVAYISYLAPPIGDTWGHVVRALTMGPLDLLERYFKDYLVTNPRIGQYPLALAGYGPWATAAVNTISLFALLVSGFVVATGRFPRLHRLQDVLVIFIMLGVTLYAGKTAGRVIFFVPFNANYVFGFALLLSLVALVRLQGNNQSALILPVTAVLGFAAGMSNEHTSPFFVGAGAMAVAVHLSGRFDFKLTRVHYTALAALIAGYCALYFAPGQGVRYGGAGEINMFAVFFADPMESIGRVSKYLFFNSTPFYLTALALTALGTLRAWMKSDWEAMFWPFLMLAASIAMAAIIVLSPKIGFRMMFASWFALAICLAALFQDLRTWRVAYAAVSTAAVIGTALYMYQALIAYQKLDAAYAKFELDVAVAHRLQERSPQFEAYDYDFWKYRDFVWHEPFSPNPKERLNRNRATVFGFDSVTFNVPPKMCSKKENKHLLECKYGGSPTVLSGTRLK